VEEQSARQGCGYAAMIAIGFFLLGLAVAFGIDHLAVTLR